MSFLHARSLYVRALCTFLQKNSQVNEPVWTWKRNICDILKCIFSYVNNIFLIMLLQ